MRNIAIILAAGGAVVWGAVAFASPTGLNNIPTADVVPHKVLVLQSWAAFDGDTSWLTGFKYGPAKNWEVGLDDAVAGAGSAGAPTLQAKYRVPLQEGAALALGAANISNDRDRYGGVFPYGVVSAALAHVNGHLGYAWQKDNHGLFVGVDGAVGEKLTLRADWRQVADGDESVASLGFIRELSPRWLVEGWASFPTAEGAENGYVIKCDYVLPPLGR